MEKHCIHTLFYNLEQTSRICRAFAENNFKQNVKYDISLDEFIIIETVMCYPDICQRDLAKLILKGSSHTSKLLNTLEKKRYIQRIVDTKNKRIVNKIIITQFGEKVYNNAKSIALDYAQQIENIVGTNQAKECSSLLHKIKDSVLKSSKIVFE